MTAYHLQIVIADHNATPLQPYSLDGPIGALRSKYLDKPAPVVEYRGTTITFRGTFETDGDYQKALDYAKRIWWQVLWAWQHEIPKWPVVEFGIVSMDEIHHRNQESIRKAFERTQPGS